LGEARLSNRAIFEGLALFHVFDDEFDDIFFVAPEIMMTTDKTRPG